ncbi:MAG: hypothetical protein Q8O11_03555, partial [Syntrophales bacterium]|nr:hypothetical protein [Syntrophales bacterium]
ATASAADVKFGGSYYLVGVYDDNAMLKASNVGYSRAYFFQRVRLEPVFKIAEGLTFTARMDALEKQWGNTNWQSTTAASADVPSSRRQVPPVSATTLTGQKIQESFEFERAWVTFKTAIGQFDVGYQSGGAWGTVFADSEGVRARIKFMTMAGSTALVGIYEKTFDADTSAVPGYAGKADADNDNYYLAAVYGFKGGNAGLLYGYLVGNSNRVAAIPFRTRLHLLTPYLKATFGPVYVEAEMAYWGGNQIEWDNVAGLTDLKRDGWSAYALLKTNLGPAYIGAQVGWSAGWDGTGDTNKAGGGGGADWNPALILMNDDMATWQTGNAGTNTANSGKANILLYNVFGGFNPTPKLNLELAMTSAAKDKSLANEVSKNMGLEFDVTAKYKIYDNLTYMVGAGYLWTGDYFKGTNSANLIGNDYILMNKLTLSF